MANIYGWGGVVPELSEGASIHEQAANGGSRIDPRSEIVGKGEVFPE